MQVVKNMECCCRCGTGKEGRKNLRLDELDLFPEENIDDMDFEMELVICEDCLREMLAFVESSE